MWRANLLRERHYENHLAKNKSYEQQLRDTRNRQQNVDSMLEQLPFKLRVGTGTGRNQMRNLAQAVIQSGKQNKKHNH